MTKAKYADPTAEFIAYEVDPKLNRLIVSQAEGPEQAITGHAYLIYALKSQGKYREAAEYIENFPKDAVLNDDINQIFWKCLQVNDFSAENLGLNVKIVQIFMENHERRTGEKLSKEGLVLLRNTIPLFENYIKLRNSGQLHHLPPQFRISDRELYEILNLLYSSLDPMKAGYGYMEKFESSLVLPLERERLKIALKGTAAPMEQTIKGVGNVYTQIDRLAWSEQMNAHSIESELKACDVPEKFDTRYFPKVQHDFYYESQAHFLDMLVLALTERNDPSAFDLALEAFYENGQGQNSYAGEPPLRTRDVGMLSILSYVRRNQDKFLELMETEKWTEDWWEKPINELLPEDWAKRLAEAAVQIHSEMTRPAQMTRQVTVAPSVEAENAASSRGMSSKTSLPPLPPQKIDFTYPLGNLRLHYFYRSAESVLKPEERQFVLEQTKIQNPSELTKALGDKLRENYEASVKNKKYYSYLAIENLSALEKDLEGKNNQLTKEMTALKSEIDEILKTPSDEDIQKLPTPEARQAAINFRMEIYSKQRMAMTFEDDVLLPVISRQPQSLKKLNPYLTDEKIQALSQKTLLYLLKGSMLDQTKGALALARDKAPTPAKVQQLGEILDRTRNYDPVANPEMLLYEYATGLMLRTQPDQAALLKRIFEIVFSR